MTYCLAIAVENGLVFASDSRTNAGVDNVNTYRKMHTFSWQDDRVIVVMSAGNLATTQSVIRRLEQESATPSNSEVNLHSVSHLSDGAAYLGRVSREVQNYHTGLINQQSAFDAGATFIIGGQIGNQAPELYLVYPEGNFISISPEHPFLQIGETKYGKPILDRMISYKTPLEECARCALVSLDSTIRSNLSVAPPINLIIYPRDSLLLERDLTLKHNHPYLASLRKQWGEGLKRVFAELPKFDWENKG